MALSSDFRIIELKNGIAEENMYASNYVSSKRYTMWNLVPKNLYEQFHRSANIWFLIVSILQLLPLNLSTNASWGTVTPLLILLLCTMAKDAFNDYRKYKSDRELNQRWYEIWDGEDFADEEWQNIKVGNVVKLLKNQQCPADILLLTCGGQSRTCHVDLRNILGETRLLIKAPIKETQRLFAARDLESAMDQIPRFSGTFKVNQPTVEFADFEGSVQLAEYISGVPIPKDKLILRGSTIKEAPWIFGLVVYTGKDTKIQMNQGSAKRKVSRIERTVNWFVVMIIGIMLIVSVLSTILFMSRGQDIYDKNSPIKLLQFVMLYNNIVPISLLIAIDLVRLAQIFFIQKDEQLFSKAKGGTGATMKSSDINDDMGQVEYVFCDKSCTITQNKFKAVIADIQNAEYWLKNKQGESYSADHDVTNSIYSARSDKRFDEFSEKSQKSSIPNELLNDMRCSEHSEFIKASFECMALNNNITIQEIEGTVKFFSRDAISCALLDAVEMYNYKLVKKTETEIILQADGEVELYEIIGILSFSNTCKISGIVLRNLQESTGILYLKGSYKRLLHHLNDSVEEAQMVEQHGEMLRQGYQTISLAYKRLNEEQLKQFREGYNNATGALVQSEERINTIFMEYATQLVYIGMIGVEDKVKSETNKAVKKLQQTGIKLCLVSGDSIQSCVAAGFKSNLIQKDTELFYVTDCQNQLQCSSLMQETLGNLVFARQPAPDRTMFVSDEKSVDSNVGLKSWKTRMPNQIKKAKIQGAYWRALAISQDMDEGLDIDLNRPFDYSFIQRNTLIIDGITFQSAVEDTILRQMLISLIFVANSVIASRFSPNQKAQLVKLVKSNFQFQPVTCAIGQDRSNLAMIQEADVGVSIRDVQITAQENLSEVVLNRFSHLPILLLKHGHWNYSRVARVVFLFLYKNCALIAIVFMFSFLSNFSAAGLFDSGLLSFYNLIFTTLPVMILGVLDQDMSLSEIKKNPLAYQQGIQGELFGIKKIAQYYAEALFTSLFLFVMIFGSFREGIINADGHTEDLYLIGSVLYIAVVKAVLFKILLETYSYTVLYTIVFVVTVFCLYVYLMFISYTAMPPGDVMGLLTHIFACPAAWLNITLTPLFCFVVFYFIFAARMMFLPNIVDRVRTNCAQGMNYLTCFRLDQFYNNLGSVYCDSDNWQIVEKAELYALSDRTLRFKSTSTEKTFKTEFIERNIKVTRNVLRGLAILFTLYNVIEIVMSGFNLTIVAIRVILLLAVIGLVIYTSFRHFAKHYVLVICCVIFVGILAKFIFDVSQMTYGGLTSAIFPMLTYVLFNADWLLVTYLNGLGIFLLAISTIVFASAIYDFYASIGFILYAVVLMTGITVTSAHIGYWLERSQRKEFKLFRKTESEIEEAQRVLGCLLPGFIKDRVVHGTRYIAEDQGIVTIIFCDICGFDQMCRGFEPRELTEWLDEVFSKFDSLCEQHGCTKIETVGKTYLACAGLRDSERLLPMEMQKISHTKRIVDMAQDILLTIKNVKVKNGSQLQLKIGVNTGPVSSGVVGHHKPQFALVGDTVNTASRMASTLTETNTVQLSESSYKSLKDQTRLKFDKSQVEAKGKGLINVYRICKDNASPLPELSPEISLSSLEYESSVPDKESRDYESKDSARHRMKRRSTAAISYSGKEASNTYVPQSKTDKLWAFLNKADHNLNSILKASIWSCSRNPSTGEERVNQEKHKRKLRKKRLHGHKGILKTGLNVTLTTFVILLLLNIYMLFLAPQFTSVEILISKCMSVILLITTRTAYNSYGRKRAFQYWTVFVSVIIGIMSLSMTVFSSELHTDLQTAEIIYCFLLLNIVTGVSFRVLMAVNFLVLIPWAVVSLMAQDTFVFAVGAIFTIAFIIFCLVAVAVKESRQGKVYVLNVLAHKEVVQTESLLNQLMPPHVYKKLRNNKPVNDRLSNVTLIFADITGFTAWSSTKSPNEIVQKLGYLFERFDMLCEKHNTYKVHTIGDCYVSMGFKHHRNRNPENEALNMVKMAFDMIDVIEQVNEEHQLGVAMRIGLHTGEVIAGITGTNIVRYDIYGQDVSMANKMESEGGANRVNVSAATRAFLELAAPNEFSYEFNQDIKVLD